MFIAAYFKIANLQRWKPQCSSTNDWIKMWYTYSVENYSAMRKMRILPFMTRVDLEGITLGKISQTENDKYCMMSLTYEI